MPVLNPNFTLKLFYARGAERNEIENENIFHENDMNHES